MSEDVVFRGWSPSKSTPEIEKVTSEIDKARLQLHELREHGRQIRLHRLQALDALETRRVTLMEILRRMEKELQDKDVYEYGDVLAEVFGERKIFAHRAVGLEALLCQYMHQMLAKQHQFKIMKKAGKDIEDRYRKSKLHNMDDFHSFDALCVQLEASRLSLEAIYDDIFASQHRILAQLKQVESGGVMTNYSIPSPEKKASNKRPNTEESTKYPVEDDDQVLASLPSAEEDDLATAMDILSSPKETGHVIEDEMKQSTFNASSAIRAIPTLRTTTNTAVTGPISSRRASHDGKTARERRREIEKKRLAKPLSNRAQVSLNNISTDEYPMEEDDAQKARGRMRVLEAKAKESRDSLGTGQSDRDNGDGGELKVRTRRSGSRRKVAAED